MLNMTQIMMKKITVILIIVLAFLHWAVLAMAEDFDLTQKNHQKLYYRISAGLATDTDLQRIVRGDLNIDDRRTGIVGFEIGRAIAEDWRGWPVDFVAKAGLIRHLERGFQKDFNQLTLSIKAYYKGFPWRDRIRTRLGFAEGVSYAEKIPFVERESLESRERNTSRFLNHLDISFDVNLADIFKSSKLTGCYFGIGISHRSGIFGEFKIFGEVDGGSNYNMLQVECIK